VHPGGGFILKMVVKSRVQIKVVFKRVFFPRIPVCFSSARGAPFREDVPVDVGASSSSSPGDLPKAIPSLSWLKRSLRQIVNRCLDMTSPGFRLARKIQLGADIQGPECIKILAKI